MTAIAEQIRTRLRESGSLLDALDALRNRRAAGALAATLVAFAICLTALGGVSAWLEVKSGAAGTLLWLLSALIWAAMLLLGGTTVGMLLSDEVWQRPPRTVGEALKAAAAVAPRALAAFLLAVALLLAYLLLLAAVLLVCRIPGLGPILYAFVFPVAALASGLLLFFLCGLALPLAAPCLWNGDDIGRVVATLQEVFRRRPLDVLVIYAVLGLLVGVVAGVFALIVFGGSGLTLSLALAVLGAGSGLENSGMVPGLAETGANYGIASGFGAALLFLLGAAPPLLVAMKGAAIAHRQLIAGLAIEEAASDLRRRIDGLRHYALGARERSPTLAPTVEPPRICPNAQCGAPVNPDDAFCIECGERLR